MTDNYYTSQAQKLLADFDTAMSSVSPILSSWFGPQEADQIVSEARNRFTSLIPQLPYVGGDGSAETTWLMFAARALAIQQAMKAHDHTTQDVGALVYLATQAQSRLARPLQPEESQRGFLEMMERVRFTVAQTHVRSYPGGWVGTIIEGNGEEFDIGLDWTECGICKFLRAHDAGDLAPYMCLTDFVHSKANGWGLQRTMTLAEGHAKCDFRFKFGRETQEAWPPRFLKKQASS